MVRLCQAALHRPRVLLGHVISRHWKVQNNTSFLCPKFKTNARTRSCLLWAVPVYTQKKPDEVSRWPLRAERPMLATSFLWHPTNPISCGAVYASRGALQPDRPCPCLSFAVTLVFSLRLISMWSKTFHMKLDDINSQSLELTWGIHAWLNTIVPSTSHWKQQGECKRDSWLKLTQDV